jgi:hypothetical protein
MLTGKKTYICAVLAGIVLTVKLLKGTGIACLQPIPDAAFDYALAFLGFGGLASLRSAFASFPVTPTGTSTSTSSPPQPETPK